MNSKPFEWKRFHAYRVFDEFLERFVLQRQSYVTRHPEALDLAAAFEERESRPWRNVLGRLNLERHSLHSYLPDKKEDEILGFFLWGVFEDWCLGKSAPGLSAAIKEGFPDPNLDLKRIEAYLTKLSADPEDFFRYLTVASRQ